MHLELLLERAFYETYFFKGHMYMGVNLDV